MGPITILDKSAFQALSYSELRLMRRHFMENLTPILALEILGDLTKEMKGKVPEDKVQGLAWKFGGSGPVKCVDHLEAAAASLAGYPIPLTGQIPVGHGKKVIGPDGSWGLEIGLHPMNEAILRWAGKSFEQAEYEFSKEWRRVTRAVSLDDFKAALDAHRAHIPDAGSIEEIPNACSKALDSWSLQKAWLDWTIDRLQIVGRRRRGIQERWRRFPHHSFSLFAPYAFFCLKATMYLHVAITSGLIKWKGSNVLDLEYLYYLPFCNVFVSGDQLHISLAPLLLRHDQSFVPVSDLKSDLRSLANELESMDEAKRLRLSYSLGSHPLPRRDSVITSLWQKHCMPWSPRAGNRVSVLPDAEKDLANREATELFSMLASSQTPR